MNKLIVNLTPTGMVPTKDMNPHVPLSVSEIVEDVHKAYEIGITMVHLHARDENGTPTHSAKTYGAIIEGIRKFASDLVICVSLSGRNTPELSRRIEPLTLEGNLKPDMGSLTLSSMNFTRQASLNAPEVVQGLAQEMKTRGILPELEAFDLGMINYIGYLIDKGLLQGPHYCNIFLGNIATAQLDLAHAGLLIRDLPKDCLWSLAGIGDAQLKSHAIAIAMGGGLRVGLEDNLYWDEARSKPASNRDFVQRVHAIAGHFDRAVMTPAELRDALRLKPGNGEYGCER